MSRKPLEKTSFEEALNELESIVEGMDSGELPLETTMAAYRRGQDLLQHMNARLEAARVELRRYQERPGRPQGADGGPDGAPHDDVAMDASDEVPF